MSAAKMKWLVAAAVIAALAGTAPADADDKDRDRGLECKAKLLGANERPTPVVTNTTGRASVEFNEDATRAAFKLSVFDGVQLTQAHIHCGDANTAGPIVAFLAGLFGNSTSQDVDGTWIAHATLTADSVIARAQGAAPGSCPPSAVATLADIARLARDGNAYVNAHTKAHPGGEIRGQLVCEEDDD